LSSEGQSAMDSIGQEELFELGRTWFADNRVANPGVAVDEDMSLIDGTIIDSLAFVELIHFIEETTGESLDLSRLDMDDLTLRTLCACRVPRSSSGNGSASV
jgi:acyl carrier protein